MALNIPIFDDPYELADFIRETANHAFIADYLKAHEKSFEQYFEKLVDGRILIQDLCDALTSEDDDAIDSSRKFLNDCLDRDIDNLPIRVPERKPQADIKNVSPPFWKKLRWPLGGLSTAMASVAFVGVLDNTEPDENLIQPLKTTADTSETLDETANIKATSIVKTEKVTTETAQNFNNEVVPELKDVAEDVNVAVQEALQQFPTDEVTAKIHSFKDVASFIIVDLEGDDEVVPEPNGGVAKFGINSIAYPNEDIPNLTRERAYEIVKRDFWDHIGADNLPENFRLVAVDTVVNHGPYGGLKLIKQADNDPLRLLDIREKEYISLAEINPERNRVHLKGWINRLNRVKTQLDIPPPKTSLRPSARPKNLEKPSTPSV
jgi:hypothetical protein